MMQVFGSLIIWNVNILTMTMIDKAQSLSLPFYCFYQHPRNPQWCLHILFYSTKTAKIKQISISHYKTVKTYKAFWQLNYLNKCSLTPFVPPLTHFPANGCRCCLLLPSFVHLEWIMMRPIAAFPWWQHTTLTCRPMSLCTVLMGTHPPLLFVNSKSDRSSGGRASLLLVVHHKCVASSMWSETGALCLLSPCPVFHTRIRLTTGNRLHIDLYMCHNCLTWCALTAFSEENKNACLLVIWVLVQ